jgi:hypothetical protein
MLRKSSEPFCLPQPRRYRSRSFSPDYFAVRDRAQKARSLKMGTAKKEASRKVRQGKVSDGMGNVKTKGENFYR